MRNHKHATPPVRTASDGCSAHSNYSNIRLNVISGCSVVSMPCSTGKHRKSGSRPAHLGKAFTNQTKQGHGFWLAAPLPGPCGHRCARRSNVVGSLSVMPMGMRSFSPRPARDHPTRPPRRWCACLHAMSSSRHRDRNDPNRRRRAASRCGLRKVRTRPGRRSRRRNGSIRHSKSTVVDDVNTKTLLPILRENSRRKLSSRPMENAATSQEPQDAKPTGCDRR